MNKNTEQAFRRFILDKKILIADGSTISRSSIVHILIGLGARTSNVVLATTYDIASQEVDRVKPQIIICDYNMGRKCGLDLLKKQHEHHPETSTTLFILVTGNTSQTAIARAVEDDVDAYVLKPFTAKGIRAAILRAAAPKLFPTEYARTLNRGIGFLAQNLPDQALTIFKESESLNPIPSLSCFYESKAYLLKKDLISAEAALKRGLALNDIDFKCMVGLYELLSSQKRNPEAYQLIKRISQHFPTHPKRLTEVIHLAISTRNYADIESYYQIFVQIDEREEDLIKYISAALVVCGKYYLNQDRKDRAMELFQKAVISSSGRTRILREIILALLDQKMINESYEFLKRFPVEAQSSVDYLSMELLVSDKLSTASLTIKHGRQLLAKGVHDPAIYQVMIRRSAEAGLGAAVEDLIHEACIKWPELARKFRELVQSE